MNEQLIVKNFGPIKDATVDFKRVTVFIGPTGGGKSTLAKLAAIMRYNEFSFEQKENRQAICKQYAIDNFFRDNSSIIWDDDDGIQTIDSTLESRPSDARVDNMAGRVAELMVSDETRRAAFLELLKEFAAENKDEAENPSFRSNLKNNIIMPILEMGSITKPIYIPAERAFTPAVEYSLAGFMRDDIGLPKLMLDFTNRFWLSRKQVAELDIPLFNIKYLHRNGQDFIKIPESETLLRLYETASGIQSVTPLLVLLEHLSRNTEQAQSFIIEEPELNLFPTAQFELVKILVEKCAWLDGQNDLVLTTHSPYVLTALNLMCYAFRIAQQDEATAKKVARLIPRHCWIDPEQFAAYYVDRPDTKRKQQVRSIINKKTGLIEENELDTASDELSTIFDKLLGLRKPTKAAASAR